MDFFRKLLRKERVQHPAELKLLHAAMKSIDRSARLEIDHVSLTNGMRVRTQHIETHRFANGGVRTSTATLASHDRAFPEGLHEYQHATGSDEETSLANGYDAWVRMDLTTILDALAPEPRNCTMMTVNLPALADGTERVRQAVFGPNGRYAKAPAQPVEGDGHGFCPCCLFTNSIDAFQDALASNELLGVRLFASRDDDGSFSADCRINGQDHPAALPLLIDYARSWPGEGREFRKQYVVIRNAP